MKIFFRRNSEIAITSRSILNIEQPINRTFCASVQGGWKACRLSESGQLSLVSMNSFKLSQCKIWNLGRARCRRAVDYQLVSSELTVAAAGRNETCTVVEEKDRKALIISVKSNRFDSASSLSSLTALCSVSSYAVPINAVLPHPNSPRASITARWGGRWLFSLDEGVRGS